MTGATDAGAAAASTGTPLPATGFTACSLTTAATAAKAAFSAPAPAKASPSSLVYGNCAVFNSNFFCFVDLFWLFLYIFMSLISLEGDRNGIYLFSLNRHFDRLLREPSTLIDHNPQKKTDTPTREVPLGMKLPFIRFLIMRKFMVPNECLHVRL